jgi:hypothetical protein
VKASLVRTLLLLLEDGVEHCFLHVGFDIAACRVDERVHVAFDFVRRELRGLIL